MNEESSSESVDENLVLGEREEVEDFLVTYAKIKSHDPEIYKQGKSFFRQQGQNLRMKQKEEKKYTIKDQLIENLGREEKEEEEDKVPIIETKFDLQNRLKNEFKTAAEGEVEDLLKKKSLSKTQIEKEDQEMKEFLAQQKDKQVQEFWTSGNEKLDQDSQFLRDYILNKRWLDKQEENSEVEKIDQEDEEISLDVD